jgi:hypothetical protein
MSACALLVTSQYPAYFPEGDAQEEKNGCWIKEKYDSGE